MTKFLTGLFGDRPHRTLIKLIALSILVGLVLSPLEWKPMDVPERIWHFFREMFIWISTSFNEFFDTVLVGAMIVVPIFLIRQFFKKGKIDGS